jgi:hypothetical protein
MAVLIEAISVIVRMPAIIEIYPGGWEAFRDAAPNETLCADAKLARVGFMTPVDVEAFVKELESKGLTFAGSEAASNIAVVDQLAGFTDDCNWAESGSVNIDGNPIKLCRAVGDESHTLITPDGWVYEHSLSRTYTFVPNEHIEKSMKYLRHEKGLDVYLNTVTGKEEYIGRTGER